MKSPLNIAAKWPLVVVTVLVSILATRTALATISTVTVGMDNVGPTDWMAEAFFDSRDTVTLNWVPGTTTANGVLTKTASLVTNFPVEIVFTEAARATTDERTGGTGALRFNLSEKITNMSTQTWGGFTETLGDRDSDDDLANPGPLPDSGDRFHPAAAHFHPTMDAANYTPFALLSFTNPALSLQFGNAFVNPGGVFQIGSLLTHDVQFAGFERRFALTEQPQVVPEPSSWLLLGSGLAGLIVWRRKRVI